MVEPIPRERERAPSVRDDRFAGLVGSSSRLTAAVQLARRLSTVDAPLLIEGETGTGKELFARAIHEGRDGCGPFVALNCSGLPRDLLASELFGYVDGAFTDGRRGGCVGKIEAAHRGTLFLDAIAEMPLALQPYLLRVLESGEVYQLGGTKPRAVRFRLVVASNRDLRLDVAAGRFRTDLFYRISAATLHVPALRDRPEDIPELVHFFSRAVATRRGIRPRRFAPAVLTTFARYPWPGNVRELRNVVWAMMLLGDGDVIGMDAVPTTLGAPAATAGAADGATGDAGLKRVERDAIGDAIRVHRGNLTRVARALRIAKSTLYLKMRNYTLAPIVAQARRAPR